MISQEGAGGEGGGDGDGGGDGGGGGGGGGRFPHIKATITPPNCLLAITGANRFAKRLRKKSLESKERAVKVRRRRESCERWEEERGVV